MTIYVSDVESELWDKGFDSEVLEPDNNREGITMLVSNGDQRFLLSPIWVSEYGDDLVFDAGDIHLYSIDVVKPGKYVYSHQLDYWDSYEELVTEIVENFA